MKNEYDMDRYEIRLVKSSWSMGCEVGFNDKFMMKKNNDNEYR